MCCARFCCHVRVRTVETSGAVNASRGAYWAETSVEATERGAFLAESTPTRGSTGSDVTEMAVLGLSGVLMPCLRRYAVLKLGIVRR